jgi:hypothetical protein
VFIVGINAGSKCTDTSQEAPSDLMKKKHVMMRAVYTREETYLQLLLPFVVNVKPVLLALLVSGLDATLRGMVRLLLLLLLLLLMMLRRLVV